MPEAQPAPVRKAMLSSTARDLPLHRKQVEEACHRMGVFAEKMMENLSAEDANAVEVSLRLVDEADVYIGIFAYRYGFVPDYTNPEGISITEMEYNRAVERGIPRLIFFMGKAHPLTIEDVETGSGARKLEQLKERISHKDENSRVCGFFQSPDDLGKLVLQSLVVIIKQEPDYNNLSSNKKYKKISFDRKPIEEFRLNDLDIDLLNEFFALPAVQNKLLEEGLLNGTLKERLSSLGLSDGDFPMLGTFMSFAPKPFIIKKFGSCKIRMVVYDGNSKNSKPQINEVDGNLITLFREGERWLFERSGLEKIGEIGSIKRDELEIPPIVLREALANALVHRKYHNEQKDQPTRLEVYTDRVEIISFGALPDSVNAEDLNNNPESVQSIRVNPIIAQIFSWLTYVELNASGILRIFEETKRAGLPAPKIISTKHWVKVTIYRNPRKNRSQVDSFIQSVSKAIISSTARDLPEHRKQVIEACQRLGTFPLLMERLPADEGNAVEVTLKMVDEADIYIGIFAHRYGFVPDYNNPNRLSITEMEYNRAVERGIPRLIFFMHDDHPVKPSDVETGLGAEQLQALKKRIGNEHVAAFFQSPEDLRVHVMQALSQLKETWKSTAPETPHQFHYVHPMTAPPAPYIAHPYVLSQATGLIGRKPELNLLTDWITAPQPPGGGHGLGAVRIFNVIAIGGMGKSALTWEWFSNIAPLEWPSMAGRFWWSFYESDAYFENFVIRALAYVSRSSPDEVRKMSAPERETQLLQTLDREPHLLVLDGLERILIAYARMDAAHLADDDYDRQTANFMAQAHGLNAAERETFLDGHRLRKTADPRAGLFLKKLSRVRASRILVSSRLYPFDLQMLTGDPLPGCTAIFLHGLSDDDALALWRHFGCTGGRDELLRLFRSFGSHPLLLQILAGEVARYRPARGDFNRWHEANPTFNPFAMQMNQAKTHILQFAFQGLSEAQTKVLQTIAAFRMPIQYDTLLAVCAGENKPCADAQALDHILTELEDRGILGWERQSDRYDLHPVVRGVAWTLASAEVQAQAYSALQGYFEAAPKIDEEDVNSLEDLIPAIELYHALIGLGRFEEACDLFYERISKATLHRLGTSRQRVELLEKLFPEGLQNAPRLTKPGHLAFTYNALALAYKGSGEPRKSSFFYEKQIGILEKEDDQQNLAIGLGNLSDALRQSGCLRDAAGAAKDAFDICRVEKNRFQEAISLQWFGLAMAAAGHTAENLAFLIQSRSIFIEIAHPQSEAIANAYLAQYALWFLSPTESKIFADHSWKIVSIRRNERDIIRAACRQGEATLALGDHPTASERLHHALTRARAINFVEEELPALTALAELARQQGQPQQARELLNDIWEAAERGPYPLLHADARNVLCQIERDAGHIPAAIAAAEQAYRLAWCDGPPWAYHFGLENARRHLRELGVAEPEMAG